MTHKPRRGEVDWVDFEPVVGSEQGGRRPALIVQNDRGNNRRLTRLSRSSARPTTSRLSIDVPITAGEQPNSGRSHQLRSSKDNRQSRLKSLIGEVSEPVMEQVAEALRYELEL